MDVVASEGSVHIHVPGDQIEKEINPVKAQLIESLGPDDSLNQKKNSSVLRPCYHKKLNQEEQIRRDTILGGNLSKKF